MRRLLPNHPDIIIDLELESVMLPLPYVSVDIVCRFFYTPGLGKIVSFDIRELQFGNEGMMTMFYIPDSYIESLINEDLQLMDLTTLSMGIENSQGRLSCFPQRACVLAGEEEAARIFTKLGTKTEISVPEGRPAEDGQVCLTAVGTAGMLHAGWKIAQNVMEYSSGIATRTAEMVRNARTVKPSINVAVTRKHFPGTKALSLKAALAGGAIIHRLGLSDSILVFKQHRVFAGSRENFLAMIPAMARELPEKKIAVEVASP